MRLNGAWMSRGPCKKTRFVLGQNSGIRDSTFRSPYFTKLSKSKDKKEDRGDDKSEILPQN